MLVEAEPVVPDDDVEESVSNFSASRYDTKLQSTPSRDERRMVRVLVTPVVLFTNVSIPVIIHITPCHPTQYVEVNLTVLPS